MRLTHRVAVLAAAASLVGLLNMGAADAKPAFVSSVPNAPDSCSTCHTTAPDLNVFGLDVQANLAGGVPNWLVVCALDSDTDGQTNGAELGDPCCTWKKGATPAFATGLSKPSDATSKNTLSCVGSGAGGSPSTDAGTVTGGAAGQTGGGGGAAGSAGSGGTAGSTAGSGGSVGASGATGVGGATGAGGVAGTAGATAVGGASGAAGDTGTGGAAPAAEAPAESGGSCRMVPFGVTRFGSLGLFGAVAVLALLRRRRA
jgi:hypothetical protein